MPVTATEAPPEMDNLYLDMNGIIHNCTHANDPDLKLTETEMVIRIFSYLDKLIHIMKPRKLVFMAIDGEKIVCLVQVYSYSHQLLVATVQGHSRCRPESLQGMLKHSVWMALHTCSLHCSRMAATVEAASH
eukprot:GHRQ01039502.1.p1 GENE.GHRQ01039502.1~~GHRQ01039502.1.p1  ORF type:complete len:132 (-),score=23.48 GHRQ01039502.1:150-545(-)